MAKFIKEDLFRGFTFHRDVNMFTKVNP